MRYDKPVFARVSEKTKFILEKIKGKHHLSNREILENFIRQYEKDNPIFFSKIQSEWLKRLEEIIETKGFENDYELEQDYKDYLKKLFSFGKMKVIADKYNIGDLDDFICAFYEIKTIIDDKGGIDKVEKKDWGRISGTNDIALNQLRLATEEVLGEIE